MIQIFQIPKGLRQKGCLKQIGSALVVTVALVAGHCLRAQPLTVVPVDADGFRIAAPGYEFLFPRDHGSHPDFRIEWWYLTGHFQSKTDSEDKFGFQATFFRVARKKAGDAGQQEGAEQTDQLFLSHMALVDKRTGEFIHEERFQRDNWDAMAKIGDLDVRNGNWSLIRDPSRGQAEAMRLTGSVLTDARWTFDLVPVKPRVIFGEEGVSRKGDAESAASLYITFPRLKLDGSFDWKNQSLTVTGEAWMDHEISSSQLGKDQQGWDWASIQLNDGREIMMYLMRRESGEYDRWSKLYWIDEDSRLTTQAVDEFQWTASRSWTSSHTGAGYPQDFELRLIDPVTRRQTVLRLKPVTPDQEIVGKIGGVNYWEGACDVLNEDGKTVGQAYVELAGYDGQLSDRLR